MYKYYVCTLYSSTTHMNNHQSFSLSLAFFAPSFAAPLFDLCFPSLLHFPPHRKQGRKKPVPPASRTQTRPGRRKRYHVD